MNSLVTVSNLFILASKAWYIFSKASTALWTVFFRANAWGFNLRYVKIDIFSIVNGPPRTDWAYPLSKDNEDYCFFLAD